MPNPTEKEPTSELDILAQARKDFTLCQDAEKQARAEYSRCMRFIALEQYPDSGAASKGDRASAGLPSLVVDNLGPISDQVINDWIRNRMGIQIAAADAIATKATAKVLSGYIRNVEYLSRARLHYDSAFRQMVRGNRGYVGVLTRRRPGTFKQELIIRGFPDAQAVYDDPFTIEMDRSDCNVMFVRQLISREAFKEDYPKAEYTDFDDWGSEYGDWVKDNGIVVAEYWKVKYLPRKLQKLTHAIPVQRGPRMVQTDEVYDNEYDELPAGVEVANNPEDGGAPWIEDEPERKIIFRKITGREVLQKTEWSGQIIPIVPMVAREIIVDGERKKFSAISRGLDAQCQLNYAESGIAAELGSEVHVPWVGAIGQFRSQRQAWQDSNLKRFAFLEYDPVVVGDKIAPPPQRQTHEPAIQAFALASTRAQNNIRMTTGVNQTSLGEPDSTAISGVAKKAQIAEGDNATSDFGAAGSSCLEMIGSIIVDVAPKILTEPEIIQILDDDEAEQAVLINADPRTYVDPKTGQRAPQDQVDTHMLDQGNYRVRVSAAPSAQTMMEDTEEKLQNIFTELPEPQKVMIAAPLVRAMNFNGKEGIADRLELPEYRKPKEGQPNIPPEAQAVIAQGHQLIQAAQAHIAQLERERDSKTLELQNKLEVEKYRDATNLAIARIGQETKLGISQFEGEIEQIRMSLESMTAGLQMNQTAGAQQSDQQHQVAMQKAQTGPTHRYNPDTDAIEPVEQGAAVAAG